MRADLYLVEHGHFDTRARAQAAIAAGKVSANGVTVTKPSQKIADGAEIVAEAAHPWVSRAALKLVAGLDGFGVDPTDRVCLDVGSSTGGFTEVLLSRGARHVYAVDVGRDQLHPSLQADRRVTSLEATDARSLAAEMFSEPPSLLVCDASFISLLKVIARPLALSAARSDLIALIKPQFEVGKALIGKGGLVKSETARDDAVATVRAELDGLENFSVRAVMDSPIEGGDGNREYLIAAARNHQA
ncbi:TlyA family RNA methyltransferase [Maricaulis maris]|uniref:23S rRNA (Cytidine1920-2'-O)/16S rRNA (Cytidine1409-2'-O)-methyltransferase n=1 Tax=Maricaulis maris TaxID=74318 RepID=A0A495D327_9PROT|nr:TlyA family RNA methyltransferase [Maricaulis maris]RKQ95169.1 23S rRNA (cytidine1920-2'-O)/16S rRNA (cytidine1409-2'-O)-methyltransferase [Maricaulis maris]